MSEKPIIKRPTDSDHVDDTKPDLKVEVVEDLDLPQEDAGAVRGGFVASAVGDGHPPTTWVP